MADLAAVETDGWHTWQISASSASTMMCCFSWRKGEPSNAGCNLDGRGLSFSNNGDCAAADGGVRIYARLTDGELSGIHALSSNCAVTTATPIEDHGQVSVADNINWFRAVIENRRQDKKVREQALFALVQTNSDAAYQYIDKLLSKR